MTEDGGKSRDIKAVMEAHASELMAIPGVTGVAIGLNRKQAPCILVLVVRATRDVTERIPKEIEGHPVELTVTGEIREM